MRCLNSCLAFSFRVNCWVNFSEQAKVFKYLTSVYLRVGPITHLSELKYITIMSKHYHVHIFNIHIEYWWLLQMSIDCVGVGNILWTIANSWINLCKQHIPNRKLTTKGNWDQVWAVWKLIVILMMCLLYNLLWSLFYC